MVTVTTPTRDQLARIANGDNRLLIALERLFEVAEATGEIDALGAVLSTVSAQTRASVALETAIDGVAAAMLRREPDRGNDDALAAAMLGYRPIRSNGHVVDYIDFARLGPHVAQAMRMQWNDDDGTIDVGLNENVTLQVGQETLYFAKNTSGSTIADGSPIVVTGTIGASGKLTIGPAIGDGTYAQKFFIGAATEEIVGNGFGYVTGFGLVRGIDTSAWSDGDLLYVSDTTPGTWTNTPPAAPNWRQAQAIVIHSGSGNSGSIFVRAENEHAISTLRDVDLTGLADGDLLKWDSATGTWVVVSGASGSFTAGSGETVTVTNGVITAIV